MTQQLLIDVPAHNGVEDENQRYTIRRARSWCQRVAGVTEYDVDAAACLEARHAPTWYGPEHPNPARRDGLVAPWYGDVFCNPPWSDIAPWVLRAWKVWHEPAHDGLDLLTVTLLLPGNRTHRAWWAQLVEPFRDGRRRDDEIELTSHFAPERFPYGAPGNPEALNTAEPNFTSMALVWRRT